MNKHGISVGMHQAGEHFLVLVTAISRLTHSDYTL